MKNIIKVFVLSLLLAFGLVGCGSETSETGVQGSLTLNGSTSMQKISNALIELFMEENPSVVATVEFNGSSAGIQSVANGTADIGNSSRYLKQEELELGLVENIVAIDGIAIIVDNDNPVEDLTIEDLQNIFLGNIKNWSEVGGNDQNIVVIGREAGSGTRDAFEEVLDIKDSAFYAQEVDSTGGVVAKVESIPGAIGYVSVDVISDSVKTTSLNGAEPTEENIVTGAYVLSRPFVMATKGSIEEQNSIVRSFFEFVYSEQGTEIIKQIGLVPVA